MNRKQMLDFFQLLKSVFWDCPLFQLEVNSQIAAAEAWSNVLKDVPVEVAREFFDDYARLNTRMPKPADVMAYYKKTLADKAQILETPDSDVLTDEGKKLLDSVLSTYRGRAKDIKEKAGENSGSR